MGNGNGKWLRILVYLAVAAVAVFSFIVSYSHIYDLGRGHAQFGTAARLLPLSVDLLIVAASLVLFIQYREDGDPAGLARWLPRLTLYTAIGATVAANVFYGLPFGWLAAVISGWPGAAFVAAVEVGMVIARPAPKAASAGASVAVPVPKVREIQRRRNCNQETAKKALAEVLLYKRGRDGVMGPVLATAPAGKLPTTPAAPLPAGAPSNGSGPRG